jgi:hypothetical protein
VTPEERAARVYANATAALLEAIGMMAFNRGRLFHGYEGDPGAYHRADFLALIDKYGLRPEPPPEARGG